MAFEYGSRDADKFVVRLPDGMRDQVAAAANANALLDALAKAADAKGTPHAVA